MKIGIITFHWGTNYGGVLQAYALQEFLSKNPDNEVKIINYAPKSFRDSFILCFKSKSIKKIKANIKMYIKERNFVPFRNKYLNLTKRYFSLEELQKNAPEMDMYICGSDQIWNPYIINSYGKPYYLNFGHQEIKRISYAPSFGCAEYPTKEMEVLKKELARFDKISCRELTGQNILEQAGISEYQLMPDPTMLLQKNDYSKLATANVNMKDFSFFYILQENQKVINNVLHNFQNEKQNVISNTLREYNSFGIEGWLSYISNAKYVVTNSYHGAVFSILFQKQFVVVPIEGRLVGMNDRVTTLLNTFDLGNRLLTDIKDLKGILDQEIDWQKTESKFNELRVIAQKFIES